MKRRQRQGEDAQAQSDAVMGRQVGGQLQSGDPDQHEHDDTDQGADDQATGHEGGLQPGTSLHREVDGRDDERAGVEG